MTPRRQARPRLVLLVVGLGTFIGALSGSTVNLALPAIGEQMSISIDIAGWVVSAYLLAVTVLLLVAGRVGDLVGHRSVYLAGFGLFGLSSLACGLSGGFPALVALRLAQGAGGAMIMATAPALLTTTFPDTQRGRALGMLATATYTGLAVGPLLGGWILGTLGWRWIFFLNIPVTLAIVTMGIAFLPARSERETPPYDWVGTVTLLAGMPLALLAISQGGRWGWGSAPTLGCAASGALLLAAFTWNEWRSRSPLLALGLFRSRIFTGAVLSALANYVALFVPIILLPYYLMEALGIEPMRAGLVLSAQPLVMAVVASPSGRLSDRIGSRGLATAGMLVLAAGLAGMSLVGPHTDHLVIALWLAVMGLGTGIFISPNSSALMGSAPRTQQGVAGGVLAVARNLGMMIGVACATTVFHAAGGTTGHEWRPLDYRALSIALVFASGVCVLGAVAAALRGRRPSAQSRGP